MEMSQEAQTCGHGTQITRHVEWPAKRKKVNVGDRGSFDRGLGVK